MKRIAIVTATRAEYGLFSPIITELRKWESEHFRTELIVTGTHLNDKYGKTVSEIENAGVRIDYRIPIPVASDTAQDISGNQADVLVKFTRLFMEERFDALMLLGDRYETLSIAIAAGNTHIPIFHLCGGDTTEGAIDEWIRHSITKISYLHFVTNERSRKRVIQMGENPSRVFNYGSTSIDNIMVVAKRNKQDALASIGLPDCRYALCTYHPVTMNDVSVDAEVDCIKSVIRMFPDIAFIFTKANADEGGGRINSLLDKAASEMENLYLYSSLGVKQYLSLMCYADFIFGNSSSGIIEAPAFHVPTVNVGDRQKGRLRSKSVIDCPVNERAIMEAVQKAESLEFRESIKNDITPYGDGHAAEKIAEKAYEMIMFGSINLKKSFHEI